MSGLTKEQIENFESKQQCLDQMDKIREIQLSMIERVKVKNNFLSFFRKLFKRF